MHSRRSRCRVLAAAAAVAVVAAIGYALGRRLRHARRDALRGSAGPVTQAFVRQPADVDGGQSRRNMDARLDEALKETFPASDPISVYNG